MTLSGPESWTPDHLSKEEALSLMSRPRRRYLVHALLEAEDGTLTRRELVNILAADRGAKRPADVDEDVRRTIRTSLIHLHLPKLADYDIVDYDRDTGVVELADAASDVVPLLRFTADE